MPTINIVSCWDASPVLFTFEATDEQQASGLAMRYALESAIAADVNLRGANLRCANLRCADLSGANLRGVNLSGANLRCADLSGANLRGANLRGVNLSDADLSGADLSGADLRDANLIGADLSGANLSGADLSGAYLIGANLIGANLRGADLSTQKADFFDILFRATPEIAGLRASLVSGRVDGSTYEGECACLVGTIANVRGANYGALGNGIKPDSSRPAEQWFMNINKGDTPENSQISAITLEWVDEFVGLLQIARAD